jgi:phosphoribosylglycinamide formyltransferase-1
MIRIAILASGNGSNAQRIIEYFADNKDILFPFVITNKEDSYVRKRAESMGIPSIYISNSELKKGDSLLNLLIENKIDWVILAGYLLLIPSNVIKAFSNKIINIHPALLPKYGGKGMYGMKVHEAVIANSEKESGITIHFVNENYDEGDIIIQAKCSISDDDNPEILSQKIHFLEHEFFPKVIEDLILKNINL